MSGRTGRSTRRLLAPGTIFSPSLHSASLCAFLSLFLGRLFFFSYSSHIMAEKQQRHKYIQYISSHIGEMKSLDPNS